MDVEFLYSFKFLCHGRYIKNQNQNLMEIGFHLGPLYNIKTILQYVVEWHRVTLVLMKPYKIILIPRSNATGYKTVLLGSWAVKGMLVSVLFNFFKTSKLISFELSSTEILLPVPVSKSSYLDKTCQFRSSNFIPVPGFRAQGRLCQ
jgi:hypothetical protein